MKNMKELNAEISKRTNIPYPTVAKVMAKLSEVVVEGWASKKEIVVGEDIRRLLVKNGFAIKAKRKRARAKGKK
jgi:hypothetical protein